MKLLNSNYSISAENYHKPTPKRLKFVADLLLLITMFADFAMPWLENMPELKDTAFMGKAWIIWTVSGVIVFFKFVTKYISDHSTETQPEEQPENVA